MNLEEQIRNARKVISSIVPIREFGRIIGLQFKIKGIVGKGNKRKITYHVIAFLDDWPDNLPRVFIIYPPDEQIKHVNIYHPRSHPRLQRRLPEICWGNNVDEWRKVPPSRRTITLFLTYLMKVLNEENPYSPARDP